MSLKLRTNEATPQVEPVVRPKECAAAILQQINSNLAKVKERNHGCWDNQVEVSSALFPLKALRYLHHVIELVASTGCSSIPALFQGFQELSHPRRTLLLVLERPSLCEGGLGVVVFYITTIGSCLQHHSCASRGSINDYLSLELTFPGRPGVRGLANTRDDALRKDSFGVGLRPNPSPSCERGGDENGDGGPDTSPVPNGSMRGSPPQRSSQSSVAPSPPTQTQTARANGRYSSLYLVRGGEILSDIATTGYLMYLTKK